MEALYMIIGLIAFYTWIHSIVIAVRKLKGVTIYEKIVLYVGLSAIILYIYGTR